MGGRVRNPLLIQPQETSLLGGPYLQKSFDLPVLEIDQVQALIYLQLSLSGQLTVFSARTRSWFFTRAPGRPLVIAFFIAQVASTLLAVYPLGELQPMLGLACSGADGVCQPPNYSINVSWFLNLFYLKYVGPFFVISFSKFLSYYSLWLFFFFLFLPLLSTSLLSV